MATQLMTPAMSQSLASRPPERPRAFNEMRLSDGLNPSYEPLDAWLRHTTSDHMELKQREASKRFHRRGITFSVYGDDSGTERLIPFDLMPRILGVKEWDLVSRGSIQRVKALNAFLADMYGKQEILAAGKIPHQAVLDNKMWCPQAVGVQMPHGVHAHIAGVDLVRVSPTQWYVLEDNLRTPSGVSYMLENRSAMMRLFPEWFRSQAIAPIDHYPAVLLENLKACAPVSCSDDPQVVVLTPGSFNSAYFEHVYLAARMGAILVEGGDLFIDKDRVWRHTTTGPKPVDVIYRRVDDEFLDPNEFRADSTLGVRGLMEVFRKGRVTIVNAVGNGVADDKATYLYVPEMIRFYLGEEPLLSNVPTYCCSKADELAYVLEHLHELVVKEVHGSGGYGMLVGPAATTAERLAYRERLLADPAGFIAQPTLALSTCPTFVAQGIAPRHVDLRPYVLSGKTTTLVPGALTRVALKEGSLVVNSSQGGGTKDTWVLCSDEHTGDAPC